jgi:ATP-binding cassette subfamily C (CFTR/MRP) protein 2
MRMNGTTKSFVANHLAESAAGVMTIRAFNKEERFFAKNLDLIDTNASPFFHSFSANEWLIQWIELVSAAVLASAALCMVLLPPRTFSSGEYTFLILGSMTIASICYSGDHKCMFVLYFIGRKFGNEIEILTLLYDIFNNRIYWDGTFLWSFLKRDACPFN